MIGGSGDPQRSAPVPWPAGTRLLFEGGYWLVCCVRFDGLRGWRFTVRPVLT